MAGVAKTYIIAPNGEGVVAFNNRLVHDCQKAEFSRPASDSKELVTFSQQTPRDKTTRRKSGELTFDVADVSADLLAILLNLTLDTSNISYEWIKPYTATVPASASYEIALASGKTDIQLNGTTPILHVKYADPADGGIFTVVTGAPSKAGEVQYSTNKLVFFSTDASKVVEIDYIYWVLGEGTTYYSTSNTKDPVISVVFTAYSGIIGTNGEETQVVTWRFPEVKIDEVSPLGKGSEDVTAYDKYTVKGTVLADDLGNEYYKTYGAKH